MGQSPYVHDIPADEAAAAWATAGAAAGCPTRVPAETVPVADCLGRVTATAIWARRSSPAYDAAAMDGIAVRAADTAGAAPTTPLVLSAARHTVVDTGDPMPAGTDAVIMREDLHPATDGGVEILAAAPPYHHVRSIGEDVAAGELLLPPGHTLRPVDLAAAAAAGVLTVPVRRRPVVAILPTGDEIRPVDEELQPGEIADTNSLMLAAQTTAAGCEPRVLPIVADDPQAIEAAARTAIERGIDLLLIVAGSSAGRDDHTADIVAKLGTLAVHGVAVRPGHPVILGVAASGDGNAVPVVGIPGYPVSAALTFEIFVEPTLAGLLGRAPAAPETAIAVAARKIPSVIGMDDWVRVRLGSVGGRLVASPLPRGAGVLTSLVRADGLLPIPAAEEGVHAGAGREVRLLIDHTTIARTAVMIGSHDLAVDVLATRLQTREPTRRLVSSMVGSLGGLTALRDGLCHLAGSHLLDPASGTYTLPYLDRLLAGEDLAVIRLVERQQGLIVAADNPLGLSGLADLTTGEVRYANRQRGAGTRVLLDHLLAKEDHDAATIRGYHRQEATHLAVAAAVAAAQVDCGLGIRAAANAYGLGFVPITTEPFDLVLRAETRDDPRVAAVLALLDDPSVVADIDALGGYDTTRTGERIR